MNEDFMKWFDEFVVSIQSPTIGNLGAPTIPNPMLIATLNKYIDQRNEMKKIEKRKDIVSYYTNEDKIERLEKRIAELEEIIKSKK